MRKHLTANFIFSPPLTNREILSLPSVNGESNYNSENDTYKFISATCHTDLHWGGGTGHIYDFSKFSAEGFLVGTDCIPNHDAPIQSTVVRGRPTQQPLSGWRSFTVGVSIYARHDKDRIKCACWIWNSVHVEWYWAATSIKV